jgi:hypothetical protein
VPTPVVLGRQDRPWTEQLPRIWRTTHLAKIGAQISDPVSGSGRGSRRDRMKSRIAVDAVNNRCQTSRQRAVPR